jgi:type 1 glutamine amidotransferase
VTSDETVRKDSKQTKPEPMFYICEHGKGRVFNCILGHYTWTFDDPYFRILMLRGMAWAAGESPYRFDRLVLRGIELDE